MCVDGGRVGGEWGESGRESGADRCVCWDAGRCNSIESS